MYRHLSIDIITEKEEGEENTVEENAKAFVETSLAHFFQPETREIKCEKCEEGTHAEQTMQILSRCVRLIDFTLVVSYTSPALADQLLTTVLLFCSTIVTVRRFCSCT